MPSAGSGENYLVPQRAVKHMVPDGTAKSPAALWTKAIEAGNGWHSALHADGVVDAGEKGRPRIQISHLREPGASVELKADANAGHDGGEGQRSVLVGSPLDVAGSIYLEAAAKALEGLLDSLDPGPGDTSSSDDRTNRFKAISQVLRRACLTAREISVSIRGDLPVAAWARWRVHFECRVKARVLASGNEEDALTYLRQADVQQARVLGGGDKSSDGLRRFSESLEDWGFVFNQGAQGDLKYLRRKTQKAHRKARERLIELGQSVGSEEPDSGPRPSYPGGNIKNEEWARRIVGHHYAGSASCKPEKRTKFALGEVPIAKGPCPKCKKTGAAPICSECGATWKKRNRQPIKFWDLIEFLEDLRLEDPEQERQAYGRILTRTNDALGGFNLYREFSLGLQYEVANQASHSEYVPLRPESAGQELVFSPTSTFHVGLLACEDLMTLIAVLQRLLGEPGSEPGLMDSSRDDITDGLVGIALSLILPSHLFFLDEVQNSIGGISYQGPNPLAQLLDGPSDQA